MGHLSQVLGVLIAIRLSLSLASLESVFKKKKNESNESVFHEFPIQMQDCRVFIESFFILCFYVFYANNLGF